MSSSGNSPISQEPSTAKKGFNVVNTKMVSPGLHYSAPPPTGGHLNRDGSPSMAAAAAASSTTSSSHPAHTDPLEPLPAGLGPRGGGGSRKQSPVIASPSTLSSPGTPPEERASSRSSGQTPPMGPRTNPVPLITPRYQKKNRCKREMEITDSFEPHVTPGEALREQTTENMTIKNGRMSYEQPMYFHTYDVYRHGKNKIVSRSVGYSSEGDLVVSREDISEPSDVDLGFNRKVTTLSEATVLDPKARRPLTDTELSSHRKIKINRPRYKKYPGIHAPRNKKLRNRLLNDHFASAMGREIQEKAREHREKEGVLMDSPAIGPTFEDLPPEVMAAFDLEGEAQEREMERLGIAPRIHGSGNRRHDPASAPVDVDSPEYRFHLLNTRLRGELQHALNSEYLTKQIEDLEALFVEYIKRGPTEESLVFYFRDGYGRLVCHGVATYYQLVSESRQSQDGSVKHTYVYLPKNKKARVKMVTLPQLPLLHVLYSKKKLLPQKHSLSVNNTPHQAPQPSPETNGEDADKEPMTPLDLGEANVDPFPQPTKEGEHTSIFVEGEDKIKDSHHTSNATVRMTIGGHLSEDEIVMYEPQLAIDNNDFVGLQQPQQQQQETTST